MPSVLDIIGYNRIGITVFLFSNLVFSQKLSFIDRFGFRKTNSLNQANLVLPLLKIKIKLKKVFSRMLFCAEHEQEAVPKMASEDNEVEEDVWDSWEDMAESGVN